MKLIYETSKTYRPINLEVEYKIDGYYNNTDCGGSSNDFTAQITGIFYKSGKSVGNLVWEYLTNSSSFIESFEDKLEA